MNTENKYKIKAFLWDQFVRPISMLFNSNFLKFFLVIFMAYLIITKRNIILFFISAIILLITILFDIVKYYRSGEFIYNYRKYKYPQYRDYIKEVKKNKTKGLNSLNHLNKDERQEEVCAFGCESEELSEVPREKIETNEANENKNY